MRERDTTSSTEKKQKMRQKMVSHSHGQKENNKNIYKTEENLKESVKTCKVGKWVVKNGICDISKYRPADTNIVGVGSDKKFGLY